MLNDSWKAGAGLRNGLPQLIRVRSNLENVALRTAHPRLLKIVWRYEKDDPSGLPSPALAAKMNEFEKVVFDELERDLLAVFVAVSIHDGTKEWSAYVKDVQKACERLNVSLDSLERFPLELTVEDDPDWRQYRSLLPEAGI